MIVPREPPTTRHVARHYDDLDALYREIWGEHLHHGLWTTGRESVEEAVIALVERVAKAASVGRGDRVCDVGCGYGATSLWLARNRGAKVTGLTVSDRQYEHSVSRAGTDGPTFLLRDWLENGLEDGSFDAIVAIESLAHMPDKVRFFREAARTLRPGGRLVVCPWMAADDPAPWQVRWLLEPICREGRVPSLGSEREYRAMMEGAGLQVVSAEDWSRRVRRTWSLVALRLVHLAVRRPSVLGHLIDPEFPERVFALTVVRMIVAFRTGAFRYGILVGEKPAEVTWAGDASRSGARAGSDA